MKSDGGQLVFEAGGYECCCGRVLYFEIPSRREGDFDQASWANIASRGTTHDEKCVSMRPDEIRAHMLLNLTSGKAKSSGGSGPYHYCNTEVYVRLWSQVVTPLRALCSALEEMAPCSRCSRSSH